MPMGSAARPPSDGALRLLNKASTYGLYAVVIMAATEQRVTAAQVAREFSISENHVAKVLQILARAGICRSTRGVGGGFSLAVDAAELSMLDVVECLGGAGTTRSDEEGEHFAVRAVRQVLAELSEQAYFTLKSVTVRTLAGG